MEIKVRGGVICVYENIDPDNPGITVMYRPDGMDFEFDLVYIENTDLELGQTINPDDLRIMVYGDVFNEDYTNAFTIDQKDVRELVRIIHEEG